MDKKSQRSIMDVVREAVAAIEVNEAVILRERVAAGEARFMTCAGVTGEDGRLYRAVVYADLVDGGYFAECFEDQSGDYSWVVYGQGETAAASLAELRKGINIFASRYGTGLTSLPAAADSPAIISPEVSKMTVAELIAALGEYPPDMPVVVPEEYLEDEPYFGWAEPRLKVQVISHPDDGDPERPGFYRESGLSADQPLRPGFFVALTLVQPQEG